MDDPFSDTRVLPRRDGRPIEFKVPELSPRSEIEKDLSLLKPDEKVVIENGKYGINDDSFKVSIKISFHIKGEGYYLVEHSHATESPVLALRTSLEKSALSPEEQVFPGTTLSIGDITFTLPINIHITDPYILLRAPVTNLGEKIGVHNDSEGTIEGETLYGKFAAHTDSGMGARDNNEDGFIKLDTLQNTTVLGVVDGMGGHHAGEIACDVISRAVTYAMNRSVPLSDAMRFAAEALEYEHKEQSESIHGIQTDNMSACFVGVEITDREIRFTHAGDSRGAMFRKTGSEIELIHETKDHSFVQLLVDNGTISREEALHNSRRNIVLNKIGLENGKNNSGDPEVSGRLSINEGDWVVLASDGVWDNLDTDDIGEILKYVETPKDAVKSILGNTRSAINNGGKDDNISVVVYRHYL